LARSRQRQPEVVWSAKTYSAVDNPEPALVIGAQPAPISVLGPTVHPGSERRHIAATPELMRAAWSEMTSPWGMKR
jgi:hypothetical protein